jgi:hypothetical protein
LILVRRLTNLTETIVVISSSTPGFTLTRIPRAQDLAL